MKKIVIASVAVAGLVGGYFAYSQFELKSMRGPMLASLKDAESAEIKNEKTVGDFICGEVNAKNSMGAYVGFKRFISNRDHFAMEGYSTDTFYKEMPTSVLVDQLDFKTTYIKVKHEEPTDEQVFRNDFEKLWKANC